MSAKPESLFGRSLKDCLTKAMKPLLKQYGRLDAELILAWPHIAGRDLAGRATPKAITKHGGKTTLVLAIESGAEFLVKYNAPELLARIEAHFGYPAVQAITASAAPPRRRTVRRSKPDNTTLQG